MIDGASASPRGLPAEWRVQLPVFEGPLDLLLHLVRVNEVEIADIPVALICDQFHEYLGLMEQLDLDIAAEYVYEAALLIHLKSKLLLPRPASGADAAEDPRQELVTRLLEYQRLREAAHALAEVDRLRTGVWSRPAAAWRSESPPEEEVALEEVSLFDLLKALREVLERYDREHPEPIVVPTELFPVRGQIDRLLALLEGGRPVDLLADLRSRRSRSEAISAFLAVLELARLGLAHIHQSAAGEIVLLRTAREVAAAELEAIAG